MSAWEAWDHTQTVLGKLDFRGVRLEPYDCQCEVPPPRPIPPDIHAMIEAFADAWRKQDALGGDVFTWILVPLSRLGWVRSMLARGVFPFQADSAAWLGPADYAYRRVDGTWRIMLGGTVYEWDPKL